MSLRSVEVFLFLAGVAAVNFLVKDGTIISDPRTVGPASIPTEIRSLAHDLLGPQRAEEILESSQVAKLQIAGRTVTLHAHSGDDAFARLAGEFRDDSYGIKGRTFKHGNVVMDVGANLGGFSIATNLHHPQAQIVALEPIPTTYLFLRWNLLENGVPQITKDQFHASSTPDGGVLAMHAGATADGRDIRVEYDPKVSENAITNASAADTSIPTAYDVKSSHSTDQFFRSEVKSVNIPAFLDEHGVGSVSFFKMDCEGCEHEIVPKMEPLLHNVEHFGAEVHPCLPGHACSFSPEQVTETRNELCKVVRCCTPLDASSSAVCVS